MAIISGITYKILYANDGLTAICQVSCKLCQGSSQHLQFRPMAITGSVQLRSLGSQLGEYVHHKTGNASSPASLQGVVADLAADMPDLQAPLRDLVSRQSFGALLPHARSGGGSIQRDALIQEISRVYHPDVLVQVEEVLNGFLDSSGGIATSIPQSQAPAQSDKPIETYLESTERISAPSKLSSQPSQSRIGENQAAPSARRLLLAALSVGAVALAATGLYFGLNPSASCPGIADRLEPLSTDTIEFKKLIADHKTACAGDPRFLIQEAILRNSEGQTQQALKLVDQAIKIDPKNSEAFKWRGTFYFNLSDYNKALTAYNRSLELDPNSSSAAKSKGDTLSWLNRSGEAITSYSEAIRLDPSDAAAFRERGREKSFILKQHAAGLADLNKAIQIDSSDRYAYQARAVAKTWLDDFTGACVDIKKAKQLGLNEVPGGSKVPIDKQIAEVCT